MLSCISITSMIFFKMAESGRFPGAVAFSASSMARMALSRNRRFSSSTRRCIRKESDMPFVPRWNIARICFRGIPRGYNLLEPLEIAKEIETIASVRPAGLQQPQAVVVVQCAHRHSREFGKFLNVIKLVHGEFLVREQVQP